MSIIKSYDAIKSGMTLGGNATTVFATSHSSFSAPSYKQNGDTYTLKWYNYNDSGKMMNWALVVSEDSTGDGIFESLSITAGGKLFTADSVYAVLDMASVTDLQSMISAMTAGNDSITGNKYDDIIYGATGNDTITGNGGDDYLEGESGNDALVGGAGSDWLVGGSGYDVFLLDTKLSATTNVDYIMDFDRSSDMINLSKKIYTAYKVAGTDLTNDFVSGYGAHALDKSDHFIYDTSNGSLYYDTDGSGTKAAVLVAVLNGIPVLSAYDLEIV